MLQDTISFKKLGVLAGLTLWSFAGGSVLAQTNASDLRPWEGSQTDSTSNSPEQVFNGQGTPSSLFDLINQIQQMNGRSPAEYAKEQNRQFNKAVDNFYQKQRQVIQSQEEAAGSSSPDGAVDP
ncbi:hypothetical protein [Lyngbya confervoides]|uniref:Uncharacterized protein n=1 Tax=Lyngbya confervoides BDU141951 TaxID=1574623 RepID=A0ABD4T5W8_9CYAN|nr:hypothetical protein [Lyngbya confervoides]MCM1983846.1 hypothetical protein [Lyngbya confervoides BDU141951]